MPTMMRTTRMMVQHTTRPQHRALPPRVNAPACSSLRYILRPTFFGICPSAAIYRTRSLVRSVSGREFGGRGSEGAYLSGDASPRDGHGAVPSDGGRLEAVYVDVVVGAVVVQLGRVRRLTPAGDPVALLVVAGRNKVRLAVLRVVRVPCACASVRVRHRGSGRSRVAPRRGSNESFASTGLVGVNSCLVGSRLGRDLVASACGGG